LFQTDRHDTRRHTRTLIQGVVDVNGGQPFRGGRLYDMSIGGAAIVYPSDLTSGENPLALNDEIVLVIKGRAHIPGRVVRLFDGGFAVQFDWTINAHETAGVPNAANQAMNAD